MSDGSRVEITEKRIEFEDGPAGATYSNVKFEYRWRVKAGNNEIVASGEAYTTAQDARRGFLTARDAMNEAFEELRDDSEASAP